VAAAPLNLSQCFDVLPATTVKFILVFLDQHSNSTPIITYESQKLFSSANRRVLILNHLGVFL
jgi:hypothetical protein